jgi:hypothetical protein
VSDNNSPTITHMTLGALQSLRPHTLAGAEKVRVGRFFDGGYVMLDLFDNVQAAYSLGINDDVSWDLDIAARGIPVYQYDHTISGLPEDHPLFHWEPKCIGGVADEGRGIETLERLIAKNGHDEATNMILKCDIEGSEWPLLQRTSNSTLRRFSQIVIEIHSMDRLADRQHADTVRRAFSNLTASHRVVHVHANNFARWEILGGVPVPEVIELTLARKDLGSFSVSDEVFPTSLDMPCMPERADYYLGRFSF